MEAPILEGPRAQNPYHQASDLLRSGVRPVRDDAACRSDPTFTRASPGLAVAEQLPQTKNMNVNENQTNISTNTEP